MASCCPCSGHGSSGAKSSLPLLCLVPRKDGQGVSAGRSMPQTGSGGPSTRSDFQLLDEEYIRRNFKLPQRALYLDPFRRPLITFPMTQGMSNHFNTGRKYKINQQILDGFLDPSEAIMAPSVFPYAKNESEKSKESEEDEEIIYILQLPDWESKCPVHNQTIRTPRFIWHSCKKSKTKEAGEFKPGPGPMNKPKPWLLSRHTDFDLLSQWKKIITKMGPTNDLISKLADIPLARPGFDALDMSAPVIVQMNPDGKWENSKPDTLDEDRLKAVVQHLISSRAVSAVQSYCCQCAAENKVKDGTVSPYVPIIMMPIYSADQCPFDMDCEIQKIKQIETKPKQKVKSTEKTEDLHSKEDKDKKKPKKRGFTLQRFTDFDLLSQW